MSTCLVKVTRGPVVESKHRGNIVIADTNGNVQTSIGDAHNVTYFRSAAKPIQGLNVILSGAADTFGFTDKELAIMCSSHYGESMHRETIYGILKKIGCTEKDLLCGSPLSIREEVREQQLREHTPIDSTCSDCSGKHSGFLAVCRAKNYPIENYNSPDHPMQKELLSIIGYMCGIDPTRILIGIDGCSVPVHALPISCMATGYARLASPDKLDEPYRSACKRIFRAINAYPEMLAGTRGFCSDFLKATDGKFVAKLGAEAVYCIGFAEKGLGLTVKIEDGNFRALYPTVMRSLSDLDWLTPSALSSLKRFVCPDNINDKGDPIGKIKPVFHLKKQ